MRKLSTLLILVSVLFGLTAEVQADLAISFDANSTGDSIFYVESGGTITIPVYLHETGSNFLSDIGIASVGAGLQYTPNATGPTITGASNFGSFDDFPAFERFDSIAGTGEFAGGSLTDVLGVDGVLKFGEFQFEAGVFGSKIDLNLYKPNDVVFTDMFFASDGTLLDGDVFADLATATIFTANVPEPGSCSTISIALAFCCLGRRRQ